MIAFASDDDVRGLSRGDSHVIDLDGASVVLLGEGADATWPTDARLEVGSRADLAVLASDPRRFDARADQRLATLAHIRGGRIVAGRLPGDAAEGHDSSLS